jgi:type VI secretion system secreted protein VgrG
MSFDDEQVIKRFIEEHARGKFEGKTPYFYGDTVGVVTIGIGHAVPTVEEALKLPLYKDGQKVDDKEIRRIYGILDKEAKQQHSLFGGTKKMPTAPHYEEMNEGLTIDEDAILALFEKDIHLKHVELKQAFRLLSLKLFEPRFKPLEKYPIAAQVALLDMAYNMGIGGLFGRPFGFSKKKGGYPTMLNAIREHRFYIAAIASHRPQVQKSRNEAIYRLFREAQLMQEVYIEDAKLTLFPHTYPFYY